MNPIIIGKVRQVLGGDIAGSMPIYGIRQRWLSEVKRMACQVMILYLGEFTWINTDGDNVILAQD